MRMIDGLTKKISACLFGALLAVMLVPAAAAHADQNDTEFHNFLVAHGINLGSTAQAAHVAHLMCQDFDAGFTQADAVNELMKHDLSQAQAEIFVGAATANYCPHHGSTPPGGS